MHLVGSYKVLYLVITRKHNSSHEQTRVNTWNSTPPNSSQRFYLNVIHMTKKKYN